MKAIMQNLVLGASASLALFVNAEQVCPLNDATMPTENFIIEENNPEYVIDSTTGLAWARCLVGQTWNAASQSCSGEALRLTWQEALAASQTFSVGSIDDWRVPNIKELASIVERSCVEPATNLAVFPSSPAQHLWSSTPNTAGNALDQAWAIGFYNGRLDSNKKSSDFFVRMVRYAE